MSDVLGTDLTGVFYYGQGLKNALARYRKRISIVLEHIAKYHVANTFLVIGRGNIQGDVLAYAQGVSLLFDVPEFFFRKAAGIGNGRIHIQVLFVGQILYTIRGVESPAVGNDYFFFHFEVIFQFSNGFLKTYCYKNKKAKSRLNTFFPSPLPPPSFLGLRKNTKRLKRNQRSYTLRFF